MPPSTAPSSTATTISTRHRIGYAMAPKKAGSVFQPSLIDHASKQGIDLVQIDLNKSLDEQAPFDIILHKLYDQEWRNQLQQFCSKHQNIIIIDKHELIEKLHNRVTMLQVFNNLEQTEHHHHQYSFGIPSQVFVNNEGDTSLFKDLTFPVIAKPLLANGTDGSHQMFLIFNQEGLNTINLQPPFVLQEFTNHGGVVFKVYVAGKHSRCVKRKSLPDISDERINDSGENFIPFSQISNLAEQEQSNEDSMSMIIEETELPPSEFVTEIAEKLRDGLKLHLFNFDVIRDNNDPNRYLVIDINYFPGYAKMTGYESMLTDFFLDLVKSQNHQE
ncbi:kinase [Lithospermum erythrorhizon]|uniref:Inositol-tetrakisphosphate 1-kinase n=1 Tax=Lithospermum erythrorhizon TaxID=34254 RepID=A0AAV3Q8C8_LITER